MDHWIAASQVFDGDRLLNDHAILVAKGQVADIKPTQDVNPSLIQETHDGIITPGFFDIQVNGGGGVMFNTTPTIDGIAAICAAHRAFGTTHLFPTVITDHSGVLENAVSAAIDAVGVQGFAGIHIEGPHIAPARRGTHAARFIRPCDAQTLTMVRRLRDHDIPTLITIAPEAITLAQIRQLADMGAVISIGHSDGTAQQARDALDAGAACFTHLFNAMSPMQSRAPGVTGTAINSGAWCSIIADGHHVDPEMLMLATRARPVARRMIAVSDAMATVGGPDDFNLYGVDIALRDGKLINREGALAGAHLTLLEALQNLVRYGTDTATALQMCVSNAGQMMQIVQLTGIKDCAFSDLLFLDRDLKIARPLSENC